MSESHLRESESEKLDIVAANEIGSEPTDATGTAGRMPATPWVVAESSQSDSSETRVTPERILHLALRLQTPCYLLSGFLILVAIVNQTPVGAVLLADDSLNFIAHWLREGRQLYSFELLSTFLLMLFGTPIMAILANIQLCIPSAKTAAPLSKIDLTNRAPQLIECLKHFAKTKGGVLLILVFLITSSRVLNVFTHQSLTSLLVAAFAVSIFSPAVVTGLVSFSTAKQRNLRRAKVIGRLNSNSDPNVSRELKAPGISSKLTNWINDLSEHFLVYLVPYLSVQVGFFLFWSIMWFAPGGLGEYFASWIQASAYDANIATYSEPSQTNLLLTSSVLFIVSIVFLSPYAVKCGVLFQSFLMRFRSSASTFVEAVTETFRDKGRTISFKKSVNWTHDFVQSLIWVTFCYVILLVLVAYSALDKSGLGYSIHNWIISSATDAGFSNEVASDPRLTIWIAFIIAAYGAIPLAVTGSVFLPNRKRQKLHFNSDGISEQLSTFKYFTRWPWHAWKHLKRVTTKGSAKKQHVLLQFEDGVVMTVRVDNIAETDLKALLSAADEYAPKAFFSDEALQLKSELDRKLSSVSAESKDFESTIFKVHKSGDTILDGKCRIVKQLLSRPLSAVYLAREPDGKLVIVKQFVTPDQSSEAANWTNTLKREYELIKKCEHESIAKVLDIVDADNSTYLFIEQIQGHDLRRLVTHLGERNPSVVLRWAQEIALVMKYLHSLDPPIIHRDLTPDNIMIDERGAVKIIDFGAAHQFMEGVTGTLIGKQCYIAPEQLRGKLSLSSDIYSFGCTLYYLATGKDPKALSVSDPNNEGWQLDRRLNELIRRSTQFNEEDRFSSFEEILFYIESIEAAEVRSAEQILDVLQYETVTVATKSIEPDPVSDIKAPDTVLDSVSDPVSVETPSAVPDSVPDQSLSLKLPEEREVVEVKKKDD